jgi:hypothetical protein
MRLVEIAAAPEWLQIVNLRKPNVALHERQGSVQLRDGSHELSQRDLVDRFIRKR